MTGTNDSNENSEQDERDRQDKNRQSDEPGAIEKAIMALSIAVTILLFAYAASQALGASPSAPPEATVVGTEQLSDESVAVTVQIRNPRDTGLITATVESNCTNPPVEVQFSYLPADGEQTGVLVCPANTTSPNVSVSNWVEA